jgi:hypothetical protein
MKLFYNIPLKKIFFFVCSIILIANLIPTPVVTGQQFSEPVTITPIAQNSLNTDSSVFIPCVFKDFCKSTAPSPFSIQIAGLQDFIPPGTSKAEAERLKAINVDAYMAAFPAIVQSLKESGAGWARVYIDWAQIEPNDPLGGSPIYNWTLYDSQLSQVALAGVQMIATISNPPAWASVNPTTGINCSNRIRADKKQDFYNFLTATVNRYKTAPYTINVWEILNEPDAIDGYRCTTGGSNYGMHGAEYADLLQGAYPVVKTANPAAKVIMGGISYDWFYLSSTDPYQDGSPQGKFNRYFTDDIAAAGAANYMDAVNFHYFKDFAAEWQRWTQGNPPTCGINSIRDPNGLPYSAYGLDVVAKGSHFLNRLKTCFNVNKPLWITEVGMHGIDASTPDPTGNLNLRRTINGQTLENQAKYVFMVYARGLSLGAENITWYALKIIPNITGNDYQGLLYDSRDPGKENTPKPAYYAFQTLTRELNGFKFNATLSASPNTEAYSFINPCLGTKIIAWANQSTPIPYVINGVKSIQLVYRPQAVGVQDIIIVDGDNNDLDKTVNGSITINLGVEPVIVQLKP